MLFKSAGPANRAARGRIHIFLPTPSTPPPFHHAVVINWLGPLTEFSGDVIYGLSLTQNSKLKTNTKHGFIFF